MLRLLPLLMNLAATDVGAVLARKRRNAILYAIAGMLAFTAWLAAVAGAIIMVARHVGPVEALFLAAALLLALSLAGIASVMWANRRDERRRVATGTKPALVTLAALTALPVLARSRSLLVMAGLAGVAFLALRSGTIGEDGHRS